MSGITIDFQSALTSPAPLSTPCPVPSVYEWEGKVNEDPEVLMMIKTRTSRIPELTEFVQSESYSPHQFSVSGTEVEIVTKISTYVVAQPNREEFSLELCSPQLHTRVLP